MNEVSAAIVKAYAIARTRWNVAGNDATHLNEMRRLENAAAALWAGWADVDLDKAADTFIAQNRD
jgi:hypothetical protein